MTFIKIKKIIGGNSEQVLSLANQMPEKGTYLDGLWISVFQCVVQLIMAANKNIKHHYVSIAAKAEHFASEIVRAVESIDKGPSGTSKIPNQSPFLSAGTASKISLLNASPQHGTASTTGLSSLFANMKNSVYTLPSTPTAVPAYTTDISLFSNTPVRTKIKTLLHSISVDHPKQLKLATRMAIGVWPPPDAVSEMIGEAASLASACRELVLLGNTIGYYPILEKSFEISVR